MAGKKQKKDLLSTDFFYMLVIFIFICAGIAYLFYSLGYSHALEELGSTKIEKLVNSSVQMEDSDSSF